MKKLILVMIFLASAQLAFSQKNFKGEIDYQMIGFDEIQKDTIHGDIFKVFFREKEINIERFHQGALYTEQILLIDSLKEFFIDHFNKSYWVAWEASPTHSTPKMLPWGMNKVTAIKITSNIAGYATYITRLTDSVETQRYGRVDLNTTQKLTYVLGPKINKNLLLEGLLVFEDHIMIGIKIISGVSPYSQQDYLVLKIIPNENKLTGLKIPVGYKLRTLGNGQLR